MHKGRIAIRKSLKPCNCIADDFNQADVGETNERERERN
jgi:hypothetical protein